MLKINNICVTGNIAKMQILIEGKEELSYSLVVNLENDIPSTISSDIPGRYKIYERQAKIALMRYDKTELPTSINASWY